MAIGNNVFMNENSSRGHMKMMNLAFLRTINAVLNFLYLSRLLDQLRLAHKYENLKAR